MKKLISAVLIIAILPFVSLFAGCGNYNLANLKKDFRDVTSACAHISFKKDILTINYHIQQKVRQKVKLQLLERH